MQRGALDPQRSLAVKTAGLKTRYKIRELIPRLEAPLVSPGTNTYYHLRFRFGQRKKKPVSTNDLGIPNANCEISNSNFRTSPNEIKLRRDFERSKVVSKIYSKILPHARVPRSLNIFKTLRKPGQNSVSKILIELQNICLPILDAFLFLLRPRIY